MQDVPTRDPAIIVEFHRKLIEKLMESDEVANALSGEKEKIGITLSDPDVRMRLNIDGKNTALGMVEAEDEPADDPMISMRWATALRFWKGDLDLMSAVLTGKIKVQGTNMDPLFRLKSVVYRAREASADVAKEMGWV
jgi:putative sterol carrier protein